jgi:hypothetical protein
MNLFLVGHSSGCIYLYDATNQTQPTVAPVFTKLYQDESFSIHLNNNASSSTNANGVNSQQSSSSSAGSSANINILADKISPNQDYNSKINRTSTTADHINDTLSTKCTSKKLVLLSSNQQPVQIAKNPLLKWSIGATEQNSSEGLSVFNNINNAGVNGVNEFAFSPCGSYLAIVSQDGYLRVFAFDYKNNQQLQIQLLCSMKSYFGGLICCCWSSDGRYIATGGEDDLITVFSFVEMRVACRGRGHSSWINACTFDAWNCSNNNIFSASINNKKKKNLNSDCKSNEQIMVTKYR